MLIQCLLVGIGGGAGAIARFLVDIGAKRILGSAFPYGTFTVNVLGCFLLGWMIGTGLSPDSKSRLFFGVGFLGAFTTFSTFGAETVQHAQQGSWAVSSLNIIANLLVGVLAVLIGMQLGRRMA